MHANREIKEDFLKNVIKTNNDSALFNTDMPLCIEDYIPVHILFCDQRSYSTNDKKRNSTNDIYIDHFKCNQCNYTTSDKSSLVTHKQIHFINGSLQCNICDYTCIKIDLLDEHMYTHSDTELATYVEKYQQLSQTSEDLLECYNCGYTTYRKMTLKYHVKRCLNEQNAEHTAVHSRKLNRHKRTHAKTKRQLKGPKRFKCNKCDYKTHSMYCLTSHNRIHMLKMSGKYPFACDQCDYKTYYKHDLTRHQRTHSDEKEFQCSLCEYGSHSPKGLTTHMLRHSDGPSYFCDQCDYKTYSKRYLTQHKKSHPEQIDQKT